jgi:hypothetical protein
VFQETLTSSRWLATHATGGLCLKKKKRRTERNASSANISNEHLTISMSQTRPSADGHGIERDLWKESSAYIHGCICQCQSHLAITCWSSLNKTYASTCAKFRR